MHTCHTRVTREKTELRKSVVLLNSTSMVKRLFICNRQSVIITIKRAKPICYVSFLQVSRVDLPHLIQKTGITFTDIKSNIGSHFNPTTGKYTCVYHGLYFFAVSIYQKNNNHNTECYMRKNGSNVIRAAANSGTGHENGFFEGSNSVFLHLNRGDVIDLKGNFRANTMDQLTSFTGFLVKSD